MLINIREDRVVFTYENAKEQRVFRHLQERGLQQRAVAVLAKLVEQTELARQEARRAKLIELYTASNPDIKQQVRQILGWNDAD